MWSVQDDVQEKRITVLRLHVEELKKRDAAREMQLAAQAHTIKEFEKQHAELQPKERKLFAKIEQQTAELKKLREQRRASDARVAEVSEQLREVREATEAKTSEAPSQKLLLQLTTSQLEATQTALQQAQAEAAEAARLAQQADAQAAAAAAQQASAEQQEAQAARRLSVHLEKSAAASLLQLPPPSKGHDLEAQHHILKLNFRHVQAELQRKSLAAEGLLAERDALQVQLEEKLPVQQEAQRRARAEAAKQHAEARERADEARVAIDSHIEALTQLRASSEGLEDASSASKEARCAAVALRVAAAVRGGAVRGASRRAAARIEKVEAVKAELRSRLDRAKVLCLDQRRESSEMGRSLGEERRRLAESERVAAETAEAKAAAEAKCAALEPQLTEARAQLTASGAELAERTLTIEALEARGQENGRQLEDARTELRRVEEEWHRAQAEAAEAVADASSAKTREAAARAEAEAHGAARGELLAEHEEMLKEVERLRGSQRDAAGVVSEALKAAQAEAMGLRRKVVEAAERERGLKEVVAREQHSRQASDERLQEMRRQAPVGVGDAAQQALQQRLHEAGDAVAAARAEAASLRVQCEQLRGAQQAGGRREAELEEQLRAADQRAALAAHELSGAEATNAGTYAQLRSQVLRQQAQLQQMGTEREREAAARSANLEAECSRLREQLRAQQATSARQVAELQACVQAAKAAVPLIPTLAPPMMMQSLIPTLQPPPSVMSPASPMSAAIATPATGGVPNQLQSPAGMSGSGSLIDGLDGGGGGMQTPTGWSATEQQLSEQLRAQQALTARREVVAAELRQLAESYKAKAEQLSEQLKEERDKAAAQGELWTTQLHSLRTKHRQEKERALQLEERLRQHGGSEDGTPHQEASNRPSESRRESRRESHVEAEGLRFGGRSSMGSSVGGRTPLSANGSASSVRARASQGVERVSQGVERVKVTASKVDNAVDRAFDKVDGLVGRIASARSTMQTGKGLRSDFAQLAAELQGGGKSGAPRAEPSHQPAQHVERRRNEEVAVPQQATETLIDFA